MTWSVAYCTSGDTDIARFEAATPEALVAWVERIERERGVRGTIFRSTQYIDTPNRKQWGTDYWWLDINRKADSEVQMDIRQVPARALDRRGSGEGDQAGQQGQAPVPEGDGSRCPHCGGDLT